MIYVVQQYNSTEEYAVRYAGSSSHQALLIASKYSACRVRVFKNGKKYEVTEIKP